MSQSYIADVMNATLMFPTRSALINRVMVLVSSVEQIDVTSAVWKYTQIVLARVEFQYDGACGVVPTLRSICILMDLVTVSADIAESNSS